MADRGRTRPTGDPAVPPRTRRGFGRLLVGVYAVFALAATARAAFQISTRFGQAPVPYLLSALAAVVYVVATVGLSRGGVVSRRVAAVSCSVELVGVLAVGVASLSDGGAFPDQTVWSDFGSGYGYVPLVLPVAGLLWLRHTRQR